MKQHRQSARQSWPLALVATATAAWSLSSVADTRPLLEQRADAQPEATGIQVRTLVDGLDSPWGLAFLPDGDMLVTEQGGRLLRVAGDDYSTHVVDGAPASTRHGQGGLMDVLLHPAYADNQLVYFSYTHACDEAGTYTTRVSRGRLDGDVLADSEVLFTAQPCFDTGRHFGSRLVIQDGYLFVAVGDRGNRELAQSLETHNGKVIRLHEDGRVPEDNPFAAEAGALPEIWTYGHRNPQGMAEDPRSGRLWTVEHGPRGGDEVNILAPGNNYGWPTITYGEEYRGGKIGIGTHKEGMQQPLHYWVPSIATGNLAFYLQGSYGDWGPSLLVTGLAGTQIARLALDGDTVREETTLMKDLGWRVRDVRVGPDGLIYALADESRLIRLEPAAP